MSEREIYKNWWMSQFPNDKEIPWTVHQSPMKGVGGMYHYFYITTTPKGEIYNGIHSTLNLDDGYHGSGDEIRKLEAAGVELKTTILEFFRTREEALAMEAYVVNDLFLVEFGVLNKVPGGDDSRHDDTTKNEQKSVETKMPTKQVSVEMPFGDKVEVPVVDVDGAATSVPTTPAPKVVVTPPTKKPTTKKYPKNWFPFSRLGIPVGEPLEYIADKSIVALTMNEVDSVKCNGSIWCLKDITNKIAGKQVPNCLAFWRWNGKSLWGIKNEILKKGG